MKELTDIAWNVDEKTYRQDPALSYSTLARYEREGYNGLDKLFEKTESPSLTFGSVVDSIMTGGEDEFRERFIVLDINVTDGGKDVCKQLVAHYKDLGAPIPAFEDIPEQLVSECAKEAGFWKADKWDKIRYREVLKTGNIGLYFNALIDSGRTILDSTTYHEALACVRALRESPATHGYFADDDEFSPVRRYYQLKFKARLNGVDYRCMPDELVADYQRKIVVPIDLKTSSKPEWDFQKSFLEWFYFIQAKLYWKIIRTCMDKDPYFKDFKLLDYRFIVVNKKTLTPLVWEFPLTQKEGTLVTEGGTELRDPLEIGKELRSYLDLKPPVPKGINKDGVNKINCLKKK